MHESRYCTINLGDERHHGIAILSREGWLLEKHLQKENDYKNEMNARNYKQLSEFMDMDQSILCKQGRRSIFGFGAKSKEIFKIFAKSQYKFDMRSAPQNWKSFMFSSDFMLNLMVL